MTNKELRIAIENSPLTQVAIAKRAKLSLGAISRITSGKFDDRLPREKTLKSLAKVLKLNAKTPNAVVIPNKMEDLNATVDPLVRMAQIAREVKALKKEFRNLAEKAL